VENCLVDLDGRGGARDEVAILTREMRFNDEDFINARIGLILVAKADR